MAARIAMMAITTSSSIRVNPRRGVRYVDIKLTSFWALRAPSRDAARSSGAGTAARHQFDDE
jgi:hypothetical protein